MAGKGEIMEKVIMFVDNRPEEVKEIWAKATKSWDTKRNGELVKLIIDDFENIEKTLELVRKLNPIVVVTGYGLGSKEVTGVNILKALKNSGYDGYVVGNSVHSSQFGETAKEMDFHLDKSWELLYQMLICPEIKTTSDDLDDLLSDSFPVYYPFWKEVSEIQDLKRHIMQTKDEIEPLLERYLSLLKSEVANTWIHDLSHFWKDLLERSPGYAKKLAEAGARFHGKDENIDMLLQRLDTDFAKAKLPGNRKDFGLIW